MPVSPGLKSKVAAATQNIIAQRQATPTISQPSGGAVPQAGGMKPPANPANPFNGARIAQFRDSQSSGALTGAKTGTWSAGMSPTSPSGGVSNIPAAGNPYGSGMSVPQPTGYQSSYTGPDIAGMTQQLRDTYSNRLASELQKLRDARDTALQGYNSQETTAKQGAYDSRNQADTINLQNEQRMNEQMANAGLTTDGQNLTLQAGQNAQRLGDLGQINRQESNALQDISQKRSLLQNNAAQNELGLTQQINSDQAAALFDLAKYGDTRNFEVDQSNYGRYRDDVNQQFAEDQFGFQKDQANIQNNAQYGGTYNGRQTVQQQQQNIQNDAQYGGMYNGNQTAQQQQQAWQNRFDFGNSIGQFGNGQQTVQQQQQKYNQARDSILDKRYQSEFDEDNRRYGLDYAMRELQQKDDKSYRNASLALQQDSNDLNWIQEENRQYNQYSGASGSPSYSGMSATSVTSNLRNQFFESDGYPKQDAQGKDLNTPDAIWRAVTGFGLPDGQDDQVMLSLGMTPAQISAMDKQYGGGK